jgi:hypothetical protein
MQGTFMEIQSNPIQPLLSVLVLFRCTVLFSISLLYSIILAAAQRKKILVIVESGVYQTTFYYGKRAA